MWSVVFRILSILGIVLSFLLALAFVILLLLLFWPVTYRGGGTAQAGKYRVWFRFRWLCGLLRGGCAYPEGGGFQVKLLWITVYNSGRKHENGASESRKAGQDAIAEEKTRHGETAVRKKGRTKPPEDMDRTKEQVQSPCSLETEAEQAPVKRRVEAENSHMYKSGRSPSDSGGEPLDAGQTSSGSGGESSGDTGELSSDRFDNSGRKDKEESGREKTERSQPLSEKLSRWRERLQFYLEIIQDGDNQDLVRHGLKRLFKIIKSLRPRFLRADVLAGLGEPDLTGYAYGGYWAVKPFLGKKCHVAVTPDFERKILEGEFILGGRLMAATVAYHAVRVLLDRRLRRLLEKLR